MSAGLRADDKAITLGVSIAEGSFRRARIFCLSLRPGRLPGPSNSAAIFVAKWAGTVSTRYPATLSDRAWSVSALSSRLAGDRRQRAPGRQSEAGPSVLTVHFLAKVAPRFAN
jgi:hypothetical protein